MFLSFRFGSRTRDGPRDKIASYCNGSFRRETAPCGNFSALAGSTVLASLNDNRQNRMVWRDHAKDCKHPALRAFLAGEDCERSSRNDRADIQQDDWKAPHLERRTELDQHEFLVGNDPRIGHQQWWFAE